MNKIILNELKKVTITDLNYDSDTTHIFIPKIIKISNKSLKTGEFYKIKLKDFIVNPSDNSTLASNWNNGRIPEYSEYFVEIIDKIVNMIKVNGVAVEDNSSSFFGWLPDDGFIVESKE